MQRFHSPDNLPILLASSKTADRKTQTQVLGASVVSFGTSLCWLGLGYFPLGPSIRPGGGKLNPQWTGDCLKVLPSLASHVVRHLMPCCSDAKRNRPTVKACHPAPEINRSRAKCHCVPLQKGTGESETSCCSLILGCSLNVTPEGSP